MKILVRLPNWLGDMVMSIGFINALHELHPGALISVIVKSGLEDLLDFFPPLHNRYLFAREAYKGALGAFRFGWDLRSQGQYDLYYSLPDSFSSAAMGWALGASMRTGYSSEGRNFLLTRALTKNKSLHRVEQYLGLLTSFTGSPTVRLSNLERQPKEQVLVNINSEASSRRLPHAKAVSLLTALRSKYPAKLVLIGGKNDREFVEQVVNALPSKRDIEVTAGRTTIPELVRLMCESTAMLSTDSGPAHLANASSLPLVVLFGAGNENNTAPYHKEQLQVIRYGQLPCEPCVKNKCVIYGIPKCLESLNDVFVVDSLIKLTASGQ